MPFIPGKIWHVKPYSGDDGNTGAEPHTALATLAEAKDRATANRNDVVLVYGEGNASARCTDYQSALLDWNKDLVHLIAAGSGVRMSPRARIGFDPDFDAATGLFKLSANGCYIQGFQFWGGCDGSAKPLGCVEVTGRLNHFKWCHIAGLNGAAAKNDILGAYSLKLTGAIENEFEECTIGSATAAIGGAGYANSQILFATLAQENTFRRCMVIMSAGHATNHVFLRAPTGSAAVWNLFEDTPFINVGTGLTYGMVVASDCGAPILLLNPMKTVLRSATDWNSTDAGTVIACGIAATVADFGFCGAVTK